jgi:acetolactate synthase-1/2/3 large subunit
MRLADYVANRLVDFGIDHAFLVTGGGSMHLNDALARNKSFKVNCFHHEQAAAIAAEGFARLSGVPCVVNVTTGPGAINALVGVFGAFVDSIPMFVLSGQVKIATCLSTYPELALRQLGDQEVDIASMAKSVVKYIRSVRSPSEAVTALERALHFMQSGRRGPVWLDIPIDVQSANIDEDALNTLSLQERETILRLGLPHDRDLHPNCRGLNSIDSRKLPTVHADALEVSRLLNTAVRPVLMVGTGVNSLEAKQAFAHLISRIKMPVVTGWNAIDLLPTDHPNFCGRPGTVGDRSGNFAVQNADLLIVLGCRLNIRQISYNWQSFAKDAFIVMVDVDAAELDKPTLKLGKKIHARVEEFMPLLRQSIVDPQPESHKLFLAQARKNAVAYPVTALSAVDSPETLNPYRFLHQLTKILPPSATTVMGNGAACVMTFQVAEVKQGQRYIANSGCASMGYDLPAAIGCAISAGPNTSIFCIAGDGSIMMNLQELQTVATYKLNIKIFILNNGGYLSIRQSQNAYFPDNIFGTGRGDGLDLPAFNKVADAFDIRYLAIRCMADIHSDAFLHEFNSGNAAIFEVFVDSDQGFEPKLASRVNSDGTMSTPELDDMAPFLERKELESVRRQMLNV